MKLKQKDRKAGAVRFLAGCLVVLLVCSIFIWGFQSDWGNVKIKRLTLTSEDGSTVSTLIYIPENATDETPAPVVVVLHGRSNQAHSNDTWCMELARRGYVVLSPDLQGGGESDPTVDRSVQAITVTEYANSLSYVIQDSVNLVGYSLGTQTCLQVYDELPDIINSICEVFGPFMVQMAGGIDNVDTNFGLIKSTADQYDYYFIGDPEECLEYVETGLLATGETMSEDVTDYDRNGYLFRYVEVSGTLHQTGNISSATIQEIVDYVTTVSEAPIQLESDDLVWIPQQLFSGVACVTMLFLLAAIINLLMQTSFFGAAANAVPVKEPRRGVKAWLVDLLFTVLIPALIFVHVSAYAIKWTGTGTVWANFLTSSNLNGIMAWLLCIAAIGIVRMIIRATKAKKAGNPMNLSDFALGGEGETTIDWSKPAKGLLIGIIAITCVFCWLWFMESCLGINYQVWNLSTYLKISPMRIIRAIPYVIIIFIVMFVGNMSQRVLPSTGNERRDMWIAVIVNSALTAAALFILLVIQYGGSLVIGTGQTIIPQIDIYGTGQNTSTGSLDYAFGYCYMMGGTTGVVTYIYRKFGNIWVGVIPAAIYAGMVTLSGFTVIA